MKKIAALFATALSALSTAFLTISASASTAGEEKAPLFGEFMEKYGTYILIGAIGVFAIIALVALIASHISSRKKYKKLQQAKKMLEELQKGEKTGAKDTKETKESSPVASVERIIEKSEPVVVQPNNYYYYDYRYFNNGQQVPYGTGEYNELATEAIRVPERHLVDVPPVRRAANGAIVPAPMKPAAPTIPVTPVCARDLECASTEGGVPEAVVTINDDKEKTKAKIMAAVALTAVGCHIFHKLSK